MIWKIKKLGSDISAFFNSFTFPRPPQADTQNYIIDSIIAGLIDTLKRNNKYNLIYSLNIRSFFIPERAASYFSIYKSRFFSALLISTVLFILIYGFENITIDGLPAKTEIPVINKEADVKPLSEKDKEQEKISELDKENKKEDTDDKTEKIEPLEQKKHHEKDSIVKSRLMISHIESLRDTSDTARDITKLFYTGLRLKKGGEQVVTSGAPGSLKATRHLTGSLNRLGNRYVLSIRVINTESGKTLFSRTTSFRAGKDINDKIMAIISQIAKTESIW